MSYERDEAMRVQEATEEMIRMRTPLPRPRAPEMADQLLRALQRIEVLEAALRQMVDCAAPCMGGRSGGSWHRLREASAVANDMLAALALAKDA